MNVTHNTRSKVRLHSSTWPTGATAKLVLMLCVVARWTDSSITRGPALLGLVKAYHEDLCIRVQQRNRAFEVEQSSFALMSRIDWRLHSSERNKRSRIYKTSIVTKGNTPGRMFYKRLYKTLGLGRQTIVAIFLLKGLQMKS